MAWHVASRTALSTCGLAEPLSKPLDLEYVRQKADDFPWWRPQQRMGQLSSPRSTLSPRKLPSLQQARTPVYEPMRTGPILREHIYTTRKWNQLKLPEGQMTGTFPIAAMSTPRLALERGLLPPRTPVYDGTVYDASWNTSVSGFFGPPH